MLNLVQNISKCDQAYCVFKLMKDQQAWIDIQLKLEFRYSLFIDHDSICKNLDWVSQPQTCITYSLCDEHLLVWNLHVNLIWHVLRVTTTVLFSKLSWVDPRILIQGTTTLAPCTTFVVCLVVLYDYFWIIFTYYIVRRERRLTLSTVYDGRIVNTKQVKPLNVTYVFMHCSVSN